MIIWEIEWPFSLFRSCVICCGMPYHFVFQLSTVNSFTYFEQFLSPIPRVHLLIVILHSHGSHGIIHEII